MVLFVDDPCQCAKLEEHLCGVRKRQTCINKAGSETAQWKPAECWTVDLSPRLPAESVICSAVESTSGETHMNTSSLSRRRRGGSEGEGEAYTLDWVAQ